MDNTPPTPPSSQATAEFTESQLAAKFLVVTITVANPSEWTGKLVMQGNFDPEFGIQVKTEEAIQQLGAGGISLRALDSSQQQEFIFECGKSTPWVRENPPIQCALKLANDVLEVDKLHISGRRITKVEITYLAD